MNAEEYYNLGREKYNLKQYKEAVEIYSKAIELFPNYNILYYERGFNYTYLEEYYKAIADYEKYIALERNTKNADYNFISGSIAGIGYIKYKQGLYDEALHLYKIAGEYDISDEVRRAIIYATGVCENEKMKYKLLSKLDNLTDEMQGHLKKFGEMVNKYAASEYGTEMSDFDSEDYVSSNCDEIENQNFVHGFAKYNQKEYDEALIIFQQCIKKNPDDDRAYFYIGNIYEIKNEYINAIEYYTEAVNLNPECLMYLNVRAQAYYMNKEYEKAIADWNRVLKSAPDYIIDYSLKASAEELINRS